jgi:hypothetical protein
MSAILFEIFGIFIIGILSFFVTKVFKISPFLRHLTSLHNTLIFAGIPVGIYVIFRIYFGIIKYISKQVKYEWLGNTCDFTQYILISCNS